MICQSCSDMGCESCGRIGELSLSAEEFEYMECQRELAACRRVVKSLMLKITELSEENAKLRLWKLQ